MADVDQTAPKKISNASPAFIDWEAANRFKKSEFPEDPERYAEPTLIYALNDLAVALDSPVHPSPAEGALARLDPDAKSSQHYAYNRKSIACDIFCKCSPTKAFTTAVSMSRFGGIGVYFDTFYNGGPWVMLHVDLRPRGAAMPMLWLRSKPTSYQYAHADKDVFWRNLSQFLYASDVAWGRR